ncbi:Hsp70 family protein [Anaeromyxobacter paludicola]|uniref:Heat-shock protein n=1 Tax=Anaeromyxobacter paludicola TaxID=2918171 RepID=A0ABN6NBP7_9BACT|nr:Hsp70 family protein [Anaeromyxobacter paludicola]BDG10673.1 heat-shock protein [Anaeromyxobacter paludicola]
MRQARYAVGIDLGTTNSALSFLPLDEEGAVPRVFGVPQLVHPGEVQPRPLLPSFLYRPHPTELPPGALALPWDPEATDVVGELARKRGADTPVRLVSSAKSWLSHPGIDRRAAALPVGSPEEVPRISPLDASARTLAHLRAAWDAEVAKGDPSLALSAQELTLTVPASFDAVARELTVEAAREAGLAELTLLEEPQAALYAWVEAMGDAWRKQVKPGDLILVCDVGGGTTDFSLIAVVDRDGALGLERVAVGDHILLGGDNMDLALAYALQRKLAAQGRQLDRWQVQALTHGARQAKEALFGDPALAGAPVTVPGRGASLLGGALRTELTRAELEATLVDGFFPRVPASAKPAAQRRTALTTLGLPYAADAAVTRHLADFLTRHRESLGEAAVPGLKLAGKALLHPTAVLFNGGVMKARELADRVVEVVSGWVAEEGGAAPRVLPGGDLDLAVAKGAAAYGRVRRGKGIRIRGGTARAYYVGFELAMPAVPGMAPPVEALCVAPMGMEEGTRADLPERELGLVVGEPARFRFFASSTRRQDQVGSVVEREAELEELGPIETTLPAGSGAAGQVVPVRLRAHVTEIGTLELEAVDQGGHAWKVEFNLREQPGA